jgi:hypothetical protein
MTAHNPSEQPADAAAAALQEFRSMKRILQRLGIIGFLFFFAKGLFWLVAGLLLLAEGCRRGMVG